MNWLFVINLFGSSYYLLLLLSKNNNPINLQFTLIRFALLTVGLLCVLQGNAGNDS